MSNTALKPKKYRSILLFVTACVILASLFFVRSTVIAKWISVASGSNSATVALFAVDAQAISAGDLSIDCGADVKTANFEFAVTNQKDGNISQVAIGYDVKVVMPSDLPDGVTITVDGAAGTKAEDGLAYTFSSADWFFTAGTESSETHTLTFTADPDTLGADVSISAINISVVAEQLD